MFKRRRVNSSDCANEAQDFASERAGTRLDTRRTATLLIRCAPLMDPTALANLIAQNAGRLERHDATRRDRGRDFSLEILA